MHWNYILIPYNSNNAVQLLKLLVIASLIVILVSSTVLSSYAATSKDQTNIDNAINSLASGKWGRICQVDVKIDNQSTTTVYNKTTGYCSSTPITPPSPPNPPPNPPPVPVGNISKVCLVGDLSGSTVPNMIKDCNLRIGLGDLGYKSDLSWFKGLKFDRCVPGNHDTKEDGSSSLESETLAYCGDHWSLVTAGGTTLIIGLNTNGDVNTQINFVKSLPTQNYKNVIVVSHKNGHVFPNAHHPAEAASLYSQLEKLVPNLYEISGHNHDYASAANGHWFISGAGGKSHYACGTSTEWPVCNNSNYGYLELTIDNKNGNTAATFIK